MQLLGLGHLVLLCKNLAVLVMLLVTFGHPVASSIIPAPLNSVSFREQARESDDAHIL